MYQPRYRNFWVLHVPNTIEEAIEHAELLERAAEKETRDLSIYPIPGHLQRRGSNDGAPFEDG